MATFGATTFTGAVTLAGDASSALNPVTKQQFDAAIAGLIGGVNGVLPSGQLATADPADPLGVATKHYADQMLPLAGGTLVGPLTLSGPPTQNLHAATKAYVDGLLTGAYLPLDGSAQMTGDLLLKAADPVTINSAARKGYVDAQVATLLPLAGGSMTGALTLSGDPTQTGHACRKAYVDTGDGLRLALTGGTLTGDLMLYGSAPNTTASATPKSYVDAADSAVTAAFITADLLKLSLAGGTMTGAIILAADPTADLQAATKRYVDSSSASGLPITGGTLTGPLAIAKNDASTGVVNVLNLAHTDTGTGGLVGQGVSMAFQGSVGGTTTTLGTLAAVITDTGLKTADLVFSVVDGAAMTQVDDMGIGT